MAELRLYLPLQSTPFLGREQEVAKIITLLTEEPTCRLLTLVGPGGIGKTRLAIQSATELLGKFADGVCFVSLHSIETADLLIPAIVDALKIHLSGQEEAHFQLFAYLQDKEMLLVLDNFEHFIESVEVLTELLKLAPAVKLLVTSREALTIPEEWLFPVKGMPYPPGPQPESIETYSALQLFAGCARRIRPNFSLVEEQDDIIRICQLVEGSPLALELAASWVKTLSCTDIVTEIQRSLDFLTTRWRSIPEKHRSVRAVFNQSWELLSQTEQAVFKRLAVFRSGFRRQAAERVAGASLVTLSALVDKSLLYWEPDGRYQIHEMLRQYASEQLEQSPEEVSQVCDLHCRYYTDFLKEWTQPLRGGRQHEALAAIEVEQENVRAAWQRAVEQLNIEQIYVTVEVLNSFYDFRGRYLEGVRIFEEAQQRLSDQERTEPVNLTLALLSQYLGGLYVRLGWLEKAEAVLIQCQELYHQLNRPPLPGYVTDPAFILGIIASIRGDYAEAARLGEQSYQVSKDHSHRLNQQMASYLLGRAALLQGEYEVARKYSQEAYALTQETEDRWFMAYCLNELGHVAGALGDYEAARDHYTASYDIRKEFDDPEGMAVALNHLGEIALWQEGFNEARQLYQQSLTLAQKINNRGGIVTALTGLGQTALALEDYRSAREHFGEALQVARQGQFVSLILSILVGIGDLLIQIGQSAWGWELLTLALHHPGSEHETRERARQKLNRSGVERELEPPEAIQHALTWNELDTIAAAIQAKLNTSVDINRKPEKSSPVSTPLSQFPLVEPLTEREVEILHLLAEGLSNVEIAGKLILAVGTVKFYTSAIYGKLGVRNRTQAVVRARELGLLPSQ